MDRSFEASKYASEPVRKTPYHRYLHRARYFARLSSSSIVNRADVLPIILTSNVKSTCPTCTRESNATGVIQVIWRVVSIHAPTIFVPRNKNLSALGFYYILPMTPDLTKPHKLRAGGRFQQATSTLLRDLFILPSDLGHTVEQREDDSIHPRILGDINVELIQSLSAAEPIWPDMIVEPGSRIGPNTQPTSKD